MSKSEQKNTKLTKIKKDHNRPEIPQYIKTEAFLENIGFFTPSSKHIKKIYSKEKKIGVNIDEEGKKSIIKTKVSANHELGLPITSDLDYYRAFLKICDEIIDPNGRFTLPIAVPTTKLIRYAGKSDGAIELREVKKWLKRMTGTMIEGGMYSAKAKEFSDGFVGTVFSQVLLKGDKNQKNGEFANTNYVWPSPWFLSNFFYHHVKTIDFNFYRRLRKPIAKALYSLLETGWYASNGNPYKKNYHNLCDEFLLTKCKYFSDIQRQLDPAHNELVREKFLKKWEYLPTSIKGLYIIAYYPGDKFCEDQKARHERKKTVDQIVAGSKSFSPFEPLTDKQECLVDDILTVCKDSKNRVAYEKIVREKSENLIRTSLSETRMAIHERRIKKTPGAYFTDTIKQLEKMRANAK